MRLVALAVCAGCIQTSVDTDGRWSSLEDPCVPLGDTQKLVAARASFYFTPAGSTLLYSAGGVVEQLDLNTRESKIVLRSDGISEFRPFGNDIVYYESDGNPDERRPINVILDHGAHSTSRYQRLSPRPGMDNTGLLTTANGIYWMTTPGTNVEDWRWNPDTETVESFPMRRTTVAVADDTSFFYIDYSNHLIVRPQVPGPLTVDVELDSLEQPPLPIGIDGGDLFYVRYDPMTFRGDLVTRDAAGNVRELVTGQGISGGAIDSTYVYFTEDCQQLDGSYGPECENLYRVPRSGGLIETVFDGQDNSMVFGVTTDRCNVYWHHFTVDGGDLYGREITQ